VCTSRNFKELSNDAFVILSFILVILIIMFNTLCFYIFVHISTCLVTSDVSKTFVTRPRSYEQDKDQNFEILLKQDQDQSFKTKTKFSVLKSNPRPFLYFYDSDKKFILARHVIL